MRLVKQAVDTMSRQELITLLKRIERATCPSCNSDMVFSGKFFICKDPEPDCVQFYHHSQVDGQGPLRV